VTNDGFGKPGKKTGGLPGHWKRKSVKPTSLPDRVKLSTAVASIKLDDLKMNDLFRLVVNHQGSDIHICVGVPPVLRVNGKIIKTDLPNLDAGTVRRLIFETLTNDQRAALEEDLEVDFSVSLPSIARFRGNCYYDRLGLAAAFRTIPTLVPTMEELGLPKILVDMTGKKAGLVLITGVTGSGKSTTLAAMIDLINHNRTEHIITIEDPIEYAHEHDMCIINQRELGRNTKSFSQALRAALREDPDIILVGEMRDLETISMAITAAETGHLVLSTLHTSSAPKTIDRIIDVFTPHQQEQVRVQLSETLKAVVTQQLIPRINGTGRVLAMEIMINSHAIANLIREGKTYQIYSVMQTSRQQGMQTMDQALKTLVRYRKISYEEAYLRCIDKKSFKQEENLGENSPLGL
jgi:twitching motility protein PilT